MRFPKGDPIRLAISNDSKTYLQKDEFDVNDERDLTKFSQVIFGPNS